MEQTAWLLCKLRVIASMAVLRIMLAYVTTHASAIPNDTKAFALHEEAFQRRTCAKELPMLDLIGSR